MKQFEMPMVEVVIIEKSDVIVTSGECQYSCTLHNPGNA